MQQTSQAYGLERFLSELRQAGCEARLENSGAYTVVKALPYPFDPFGPLHDVSVVLAGEAVAGIRKDYPPESEREGSGCTAAAAFGHKTRTYASLPAGLRAGVSYNGNSEVLLEEPRQFFKNVFRVMRMPEASVTYAQEGDAFHLLWVSPRDYRGKYSYPGLYLKGLDSQELQLDCGNVHYRLRRNNGNWELLINTPEDNAVMRFPEELDAKEVRKWRRLLLQNTGWLGLPNVIDLKYNKN